VSGTSTTPYNTAVGGTDFDWANLSKAYWNSANASNGSSALSYIPEVPWNSSCASLAALQLYGFTAAGYDQEQSCRYMINNNFDTGMVTVAGGTGGKSACTARTGDICGRPRNPHNVSNGKRGVWSDGERLVEPRERVEEYSTARLGGGLSYYLADCATGKLAVCQDYIPHLRNQIEARGVSDLGTQHSFDLLNH
jgi:hypothetical protein